jgi:hypothetical protein
VTPDSGAGLKGTGGISGSSDILPHSSFLWQCALKVIHLLFYTIA